jgi:hypothetical protein
MAKTCDSLVSGGPFKQTIFLGCSVASFSASVGWNEQNTSIDVRLVYDPCPSTDGKYYWDTGLVRQISFDPDPGFLGEQQEIIGCPAYFRVGDFEFCGIIQNWTKDEGQGGTTYSVQLSDPRQLLENSKLILTSYAGTVGGLPNVFNVFGFCESFGTVNAPLLSQVNGSFVNGDYAPDGAIFGSPAAKFGGANTNQLGMPWYNILGSLKLLTSSIPVSSSIWSPYGRILFKGPTSGGYGLLPPDALTSSYYLLDLSNLPIPPSSWRVGGVEVSILSLISDLCGDAGYDYYIELVPAIYNSIVYKIIKVRTVSRYSQPSLNTISSFIGDGDGTNMARIGRELRNETTSAICIGGQKQTLYQAIGDNTVDSTILPYFGLDPWTNNTLLPYHDEFGDWCIDVDTTILNAGLTAVSGVGITGITGRTYAHITESEMMAALVGYDTWTSIATNLAQISWSGGHQYSDIGTSLGGDGEFMLYNLVEQIASGSNLSGIKAAHLVVGAIDKQMQVDKHNSQLIAERQMLHQWVLGFANNLGRSFQVAVPYVCARREDDSYQIVFSEQPVNGGWTEQSTVLGMSTSDIYYQYLLQEDNKTSTLLVFPDSDNYYHGKDISQLGDSCLLYGGYIYCLADVDESNGYVFENYSMATGPRAVVKLQAPISIVDTGIPLVMGGLESTIYKMIDRLSLSNATAIKSGVSDKMKGMANKVGGKSLHYPYTYYCDTNPAGAAFGIHSNILTYGPWFQLGPLGGTKVIQDEDLVPWNYYGYTNLNLIGNSKAEEGLTQMQVGENGSITVAGYPAVPLGAELGAMAGGFYGGGQHLVESRTISTSTFQSSNYIYLNEVPWQGIYGPNITNIDVQVGFGGLTTTYAMRTFTPKFGRFTKQNAERLKMVASANLKMQKFWKDVNKVLITSNINQQIRAGNTPYRITTKDMGLTLTNQSPHHIMMGDISVDGSGFATTTVISNPLHDIKGELSDYENKAMMSLEGLFRPVSLYGTGNLPRLAQPNEDDYAIIRAIPPMTLNGTGIYNNVISSNYLHPLQNPSGDLITERSETYTTGVGHDIGVVGANSIPSISYGQSPYADDYRFMALRGPLIMQGWGYDIDGKPIPNAADVYGHTTSGIYVNELLQDKFMPDWLQKPQTWPVAPVDLRYDRNRGVWTVPNYDMLSVELLTSISAFGTGIGRLLNTFPLFDNSGILIDNSDARVAISETLGKAYSSGNKVVVSWNGHSHNHFIVSAGGGGGISLGTLTTALSAGGSGTATLSYGNTATGIAVYDYLLPAGTTLTIGTKIVCAEADSKQWVIEAGCNV